MKLKKISGLGLAMAITILGGSFAYANSSDLPILEKIQSIFGGLKSGEVKTFEDGSKALKNVENHENGITSEVGVYVTPDSGITDEELENTQNQQELGELQFSGSVSTEGLEDGEVITGEFK